MAVYYYNLQINCSPRFVHQFYAPRFTCKSNKPLCHVPMKTTMSQHQHQSSYSASITADIEAHLKQSITLKPPLSVHEPMYNLVFSAPPNSAPSLCVAACELVGGHRSKAIAAASALRLLHAANFTHEHLPLTDSPSPSPVIHNSYDPSIQLLMPDAILPLGFELLAQSYNPAQNNSDRVLRVIVEFARAFGSKGILDGQYRQRVVSISNGDEVDNAERVDCSGREKEGKIHACAAACGAILGDANEEEIEKLRTFGLYVGMIQGYSIKFMREREEENEAERIIKELRNLALKELEHFHGRKLEPISSFIYCL